MIRKMCKSKLQNLIVTDANVNYSGSIAIDEILLEKADISPYEMVLVVNIENGERLETYAMPEEKGSGIVGLRGGAAKKGKIGDRLIIMSYAFFEKGETENFKPKILIVDEKNRIKEERN